MREAMLKGLENIKLKKSVKFNYYPKDGKEGKAPQYIFPNVSGNKILNKNHLTKLK